VALLLTVKRRCKRPTNAMKLSRGAEATSLKMMHKYLMTSESRRIPGLQTGVETMKSVLLEWKQMIAGVCRRLQVRCDRLAVGS
jgi:hypothetical protein